MWDFVRILSINFSYRMYLQWLHIYLLNRPLYQYEGANTPTSTGPAVQSGFPTAAAINLSVKCIAAASTGMKPLPLPLPLPLTRSPGTVSVMDLSTSSVTSTSPQVQCVLLAVIPTRAEAERLVKYLLILFVYFNTFLHIINSENMYEDHLSWYIQSE